MFVVAFRIETDLAICWLYFMAEIQIKYTIIYGILYYGCNQDEHQYNWTLTHFARMLNIYRLKHIWCQISAIKVNESRSVLLVPKHSFCLYR